MPDNNPPRYYRRVLRIRAEDSPNVRLGLAQQRAGIIPTGQTILPGVLPWSDYVKRRATWDPIRQCVGLDGRFYEGAEILLFPPHWLNHSEHLADQLRGSVRKAEAVGIDTAEGGDNTAIAAVDRYGLIDLESIKTPDTSIIPGWVIAFAQKHSMMHNPENWVFDRGGGGQQHADTLRRQGFAVRTVGFGETLSLDPRRGLTFVEERKEVKEERYVYKNRRAEMYGTLSERCDPSSELGGFSIPSTYSDLRLQLSPIPRLYDGEGRLYLPPKHKRDSKDTTITLVDLIGHSPDEADAVVLAVHGMVNQERVVEAGAIR